MSDKREDSRTTPEESIKRAIGDGGPAFPHNMNHCDPSERGMSLRVHAAIELRVPDSGLDWLDAMIRKSLRGDLAGQALAGLLANQNSIAAAMQEARLETVKCVEECIGVMAYSYADAMLEARDA